MNQCIAVYSVLRILNHVVPTGLQVSPGANETAEKEGKSITT